MSGEALHPGGAELHQVRLKDGHPVTVLRLSPDDPELDRASALESRLGQRACRAWSSPIQLATYGDRELLYWSYALLDAEQGVFISRDLGETWEHIHLGGPFPWVASMARWHPLCGEAWQFLRND